MKKRILALVLAIAATSAFAAESVTVEVDHLKGVSNSVAVIPAVSYKGFTLDAKLQAGRSFDQTDSTNIEVRARKDIALTKDLTVFVRAGLGKGYADNTSTSYYTVEPGVAFALGNLSLNASDLYTNSIHTGQPTLGNKISLGADFALDAKDTLGVKVYHQKGDLTEKGIVVGLTRSF